MSSKIVKLENAKNEFKREYAIIAGDLTTFVAEHEKILKEHDVIEQHISSQLMQIPNPDYMKGITVGKPEFVTTVIISALIIFRKKKEATNKTVN